MKTAFCEQIFINLSKRYRMNFFSNLKIKTKIVLVTSIPMLALLIIAATVIGEKTNVVNSMKLVRAQALLVTKASNLVHEIQKERGLTAGYLGSKGTKFSSELSKQQGNSDERYSELKDYYTESEDVLGKTIVSILNKADVALKNRSDIRRSVKSTGISTKDAIEYYTSTNELLLGVIPVILNLNSNNRLSHLFSAYYLLLQGKERAGIERAVLSNVFSQNEFSEATYGKFTNLLNEQATYFSTFSSFAEGEFLKKYNAILSTSTSRKIERLRETAKSSRTSPSIGVDATEWFLAATDRINLLKELEDSMSEEILVYSGSEKSKAEKSLVVVVVLFVLVILVSLVSLIIVLNKIVSSLNNTIMMLKDIADGEGDLRKRLEVTSKDEIGVMSIWFNQFIENIQTIISNMSTNVLTLSSSSEELSAVSSQLLAGSEGMVVKANGVASATEEMSTNISTMASAAEEMSVNANEVAGAAEQTSVNMDAVSSAVEEMSVSIGQIAKDTSTAREVASEATQSSKDATASMGILSDAAKEIGTVTGVIKRIAEQTNLLALNATIEAASAGEAGKGFAVVANEIKELANQSAKAADDISGRIDGVQTNTEEAVGVITSVSEIIDQIGSTINNIAQAVEQQSSAVTDISANVTQASTGVQNIASSIAEVAKGATDVSRNSGEASSGVTDVTASISEINGVAQESSAGATQVSSSANELAKMGSELRDIVGKFTV
jgi:methyl-accepting chemotaxis protein